MSNALAIAAVTAVVRDLLNDGLVNANLSGITGGNVDVTVLPPDLVVTDDEAEGLNLFMYGVAPNSGWRNVGLPSRNAQGKVVNSNPLALDLHYLLTAHSRNAYHGEILLGYGMQLLHEMPVLTRDGIRRSLGTDLPTTVLPPALRSLSGSDLADQVEQIKFTYQPMGTEELFRLWASFQAPYRPTAAYHASVVLIERKRPAKLSLPVLRPSLYVAPFNQPIIDRLIALDGVAQSFVASSTLIIQGQRLRGESTQVRIGPLVTSPSDVSQGQIRIPLQPLVDAPDGLKAGVQSVQVVHVSSDGGGASTKESNIAALILRPTITSIDKEPMGCSDDDDGIRRCAATLVVTISPPVGRDQRVIVRLNQLTTSPDERAQTYQFNAPENNGITDASQSQTNMIRFSIAGIIPGTYLVRIQVDGAESLPEINTNVDNPTYNQYTGNPQVSLGP